MKLVTAVRRAIKALDDDSGRSAGVASLAVTYAAAIDDHPEKVEELGPLLLLSLDALLLTPKARANVMKGARRGTDGSPLDELRQRRAQRQHDAAAMDTTTP